VDRTVAIQQLPELHAVAIRLNDDNYGDLAIAVALGIGEDEVATLVQIANQKLNRLISSDAVPTPLT
jgi:hypothetical protein